MASVYVEVDPMEFEDEELIKELRGRGYAVTKIGIPATDDSHASPGTDDVTWLLRRGEIEEALRLIGRNLGGEFVDLPETIRRRFS